MAYLDSFVVHPEYREQGIGRATLQLLEKQMQTQGMGAMELYSLRSAQGFYQKLDYSPIKQSAVSATMRKELSG